MISLTIRILYGGPGGSSGKALGYGLDGPGSIPGVVEVEMFLHSFGMEIFLHFFVSRLVLGVYSASYKMSTVPGSFTGGKGDRA